MSKYYDNHVQGYSITLITSIMAMRKSSTSEQVEDLNEAKMDRAPGASQFETPMRSSWHSESFLAERVKEDEEEEEEQEELAPPTSTVEGIIIVA